jgi:CheY-like chemotaxis protein
VDDSENDVTLMNVAFRRARLNNPLQVVHNGEEAIAYLAGQRQYTDRKKFPLPAVMLLDLNMPMKDGFEVLDWLRKQSGLKRFSIIVLTASLRPEDVERAFELGAHSYLVKPAALDDLVTMIQCLRDWLKLNHFPPLDEHIQR